MHRLIALCAYQTEKGHCSLYHFESGIDGVRLSHNTPLINTLRVAAATHAEYEQIVADFEIANDTYYTEQERKHVQGENGAARLVDSFANQNVAPEAR